MRSRQPGLHGLYVGSVSSEGTDEISELSQDQEWIWVGGSGVWKGAEKSSFMRILLVLLSWGGRNRGFDYVDTS